MRKNTGVLLPLVTVNSRYIATVALTSIHVITRLNMEYSLPHLKLFSVRKINLLSVGDRYLLLYEIKNFASILFLVLWCMFSMSNDIR
jgi:hypothetical protein